MRDIDERIDQLVGRIIMAETSFHTLRDEIRDLRDQLRDITEDVLEVRRAARTGH